MAYIYSYIRMHKVASLYFVCYHACSTFNLSLHFMEYLGSVPRSSRSHLNFAQFAGRAGSSFHTPRLLHYIITICTPVYK